MGRRSADVMRANVVVRHHIVQICLEHCGEKIKLPSAREYAKKLGFSIRTIASEMAVLVREGWIIGLRGVGYFTNPNFNKDYNKQRRVSGLILSDSLFLEYDFNQWSFLAEAGTAVTRRLLAFVRPLYFGEHDMDRFYQKLQLENLDALVSIMATDEMDRILIKFAETGRPVISVLKHIPGLSCVTNDWAACGRVLAEKAMARNPVPDAPILWYTGFDPFHLKVMESFKNTFRGNNPLVAFGSHSDMVKYLHNMLKTGKRPAILSSSAFITKKLYDEFVDCSAEPWKDIVWIGDTYNLPLIPGYTGLGFCYQHKKIAESAAILLEEQFAGKRPREISIEMEVSEINNAD